MNSFKPPVFLATALLALLGAANSSGLAAEDTTRAAAFGPALLLYAPFDGRLDAEFAVGDPKLYTAPAGNRQDARAGLPDDNLVVLAKGAGRHGDALHFTRKMKPVVFFRGEKNLGYHTSNWSGSASLWLRSDPDKDLEPGYCDPLQFVAQSWGEGNMFIEFSKDHTPRHFRYAILAVTRYWNPKNLGWEAIPEAERPMVPVHKPPFARDKWTHVAFTFANVNSGRKDGRGKLYLDGEYQGEFTGWENTFHWNVPQSTVTLGLSYVGWLDELALFNRPLTDAEVKLIHQTPGGLRELIK